MADIKSAWEIAQEKLSRIGEATPEERLGWQYTPEGEKLGVRYLQENINLLVEIQKYAPNTRPYVIASAEDVMIRNIILPRDDISKKANRRAMDGLKVLKTDKAAVENVFSQLRRLFAHYIEQGQKQKQQAYETLKADFEAKVREAVKQQAGTLAGQRIDVERQPQFQEEWRRVQTRLEMQYIKLLDEYKQGLRAVS